MPRQPARFQDVVIVRDGDFVGAVAPDEATLSKAIGAIKAEWSSRSATVQQ